MSGSSCSGCRSPPPHQSSSLRYSCSRLSRTPHTWGGGRQTDGGGGSSCDLSRNQPDEQLCSLLQSQRHLVGPLQGVGVEESLETNTGSNLDGLLEALKDTARSSSSFLCSTRWMKAWTQHVSNTLAQELQVSGCLVDLLLLTLSRLSQLIGRFQKLLRISPVAMASVLLRSSSAVVRDFQSSCNRDDTMAMRSAP
ncbi:hypothetical protein INR49_022785 [Caranx melampygus]|nr:hypothetical protein INR49_022785 [Caranx melampygus]